MAIEAVAAIAAKEVAVQAAKEAALQAGREIAQKMATDAGVQNAGSELQNAMMERQTMQDGARIGEMPETKGEGREILKQRESAAAEELRGKLEAEETQSDTAGNSEMTEEANPEVQKPSNTAEKAETPVAETQEVVEQSKAAESAEGGESAELAQVKSEYADDLVSRSEVPDTINKEAVTNATLEKVSPEQCQAARVEFNKVKSDLISQWEKQHGMEWPRYKDDVYLNGTKIRQAGDLYDCHHIQPLTYGGKNEVANITPMHALEHFDRQGLHAFNSPYAKLENLLKLKEVA